MKILMSFLWVLFIIFFLIHIPFNNKALEKESDLEKRFHGLTRIAIPDSAYAKPEIRFSNVTIPKGAVIDSAVIILR